MIARSNAMISRAEAQRWNSSPKTAASPCGAARRDRRRGRKTPRLRSPRCRAKSAAGAGTRPPAARGRARPRKRARLRASDGLAPRRESAARCRGRRARPRARASARRRIPLETPRTTRRRHKADWRGSDRSASARAGRTDRPEKRDPVGKVVLRDIAARHIERVGGEIDRVDPGVGECLGREDRQRAAAGA